MNDNTDIEILDEFFIHQSHLEGSGGDEETVMRDYGMLSDNDKLVDLECYPCYCGDEGNGYSIRASVRVG